MAYARRTDPETSHDAAQSVRNLTETQNAILEMCTKPITDHKLVVWYQSLASDGVVPHASESGIRSRRSELVDKGLIIDSGQRSLSPSGRKQILWQTFNDGGTLW